MAILIAISNVLCLPSAHCSTLEAAKSIDFDGQGTKLPVRKEPGGWRIKCTCMSPQASQAPSFLKGARWPRRPIREEILRVYHTSVQIGSNSDKLRPEMKPNQQNQGSEKRSKKFPHKPSVFQ